MRYAPGHVLWEPCHAVRRRVLSDAITGPEGEEAIERLVEFSILLWDLNWSDVREIWSRFVSGFDYLVTPYDAGYLYVAEQQGCEFWTADDRLLRTVAAELPWVRSLSEFAAQDNLPPEAGWSGDESDGN